MGRDDPARFRQDVVGAHRVPGMGGQPLGAVVAAGLLVGHRQVDQGALGPKPGGGEVAGGDGHGCRQVEHVDGAAAPNLAVDELAAEGILAPVLRCHRDDVGVAHQAHRRGFRVPAFDAGDQRGALGERLVALEVEAAAGEVGPQHVDAALFMARRRRPVVDALVADELLQQLGDLTYQRFRHPPARYPPSSGVKYERDLVGPSFSRPPLRQGHECGADCDQGEHEQQVF